MVEQEQFITHVIRVSTAVRDHSLDKLGRSPLVKDLSHLLQKYLPETSTPIARCSPILIGDVLRRVFLDAIEFMRVDDSAKDEPAWRYFTYLHEHIVLRKPWGIVASDCLHVGRSTFYEVKNQALRDLAEVLLLREVEAEMGKNVEHNLGRPPYLEFVPRLDESGNSYVDDVIIPALQGRWWIVALVGEAGVGKSSLAYATASRCLELSREGALPFEAVIFIEFKQEEYQFGNDRIVRLTLPSMAMALDTIGDALHRQEVLQCALPEKYRIVADEFKRHVCLLVLDNVDSALLPEGTLAELADFVKKLPAPQKALVTLRTDQFWAGMYSIRLKRMSLEEARQLLQNEATMRQLLMLTDEEFQLVFDRTAGNPLAMKQAMGLVRVMGFKAEAATDFPEHSHNMLLYMYERAYQRLSENAKKVLLLMPVFPTDVSGDTLEHGAGLTDPEMTAAMGLLYRSCLVEKHQSDRYAIVPLLAEFLRDVKRDPQAQVEGQSVQEWMATSYVRLAQYFIHTLSALQDRVDSTLLILKSDRRNILAIMQCCDQVNCHEPLLELLELVGPGLGTLRHLLDRQKWAERAVEICRQLGRPEQAEWFRIRDLAWTLVRLGTEEGQQEGRRILEESNTLAQQQGWKKVQALALRNLGVLAIDRGEYATARTHLEQSVALWAEIGAGYWRLLTQRYLAQALVHLGEINAGLAILEEILPVFRAAGDLNSQVGAANCLALVYAVQGKCAEARRLCENNRQLAGGIEDPAWALAASLHVASQVEERCGTSADATKYEEEALGIYERAGMRHYAAKSMRRLEMLRGKQAAA